MKPAIFSQLFGKHTPTSFTKLYAHSALSLPPLEGIFSSGLPEVQEWLHANKWNFTEYNNNFPDKEPTSAYERELQSTHPLYTDSACAILGGWHLPWPDEDWQNHKNKRFIAMTIKNSEPWVEVWLNNDGTFSVVQRIT
jgi:hypothetical protein